MTKTLRGVDYWEARLIAPDRAAFDTIHGEPAHHLPVVFDTVGEWRGDRCIRRIANRPTPHVAWVDSAYVDEPTETT